MKKNPFGFASQSFTRKYKITVGPITRLGAMVILCGILLLLVILDSHYDNLKLQQVLLVSVMFLFISVNLIHTAFKHLQKRIDELEKKLDTNQTEEKA